jgi:parallel beta-helix repeat protein
MSVFQEQSLPTFVPTVAQLATSRARTINGGTIQTAGYAVPGDGGGSTYIYRKTGRSGVTIDGGFFLAGPGVDDYFEAKDQAIADIRQFGVSSTRTATQNAAALQAAVDASRRVFVPEGTDITIDDSITVPDNTVIEGKGETSRITLSVSNTDMFIAGEGCLFHGLHLIGPNSMDIDIGLTGGAIKIVNTANVTVSDCIIEKWTWFGVYAQQSFNLTIKNNTFFSNLRAQSASADILVYQSSNNGRMVIDGNLCLSNNTAGISLNGIGGSGKVVCVNNVIVALDPTTCIPGGTWEEIAPGESERQHGIILGYANDISDVLVSNNIIENTDWTGIYKPGTSNGPVVISNNICRRTGYDLISAQTITGAIYVAASGGESIIGNSIFDYQGNQGAININTGTTNDMPVLVSNNTIADSLGYGVLLGGRASNIAVKDNVITGSAGVDIFVGPVADTAGITEHTIEGNVVYRTNANAASVFFDRQGSNQLVTIKNNRFVGHDKTANTANQVNTAIYHTSTGKNVQIVGNVISNYWVGINHATYWSGRHTDYHLSYNHFNDCTYGISLSSIDTAVIVFLEGNTFRDIVSGNHVGIIGYPATMDAKIFGNNVQVYVAAKPTTGTWAVGDIAWNSSPGTMGPMGWLCTVAGNPGTWLRLMGSDDGVITINDEDEALSVDRRKTVVYLQDLTADRLVTLPPDSLAPEGDSITIRRAGGGAFDLTVDALAVIDKDGWVKVKHDGSGYVIDSSSTPLTKVWSKITSDANLDIWLNGDADLNETGDPNDLQGNENATWVGTPAYVAKPPQGSAGSLAFDLDGASKYLTLPSAATSFTDNFSIACWYKQAEGSYRIFSKLSNVNTGYEAYVGDYIFYFRGGEGLHFLPSPIILPDTWYHFVVSINGADSAIYVNGVRRLTFSPTITTNSLDLRLGAWAFAINPPVPLDGQISDFMFFSKALATHEAKVLALGP